MKVQLNGETYDVSEDPAARTLWRWVDELDREVMTLRAALEGQFKNATVTCFERSEGERQVRGRRIEIVEEVL